MRVQRGWLYQQRGFVLIASYMVVAVLLILQSAYFSRIAQDHKLAIDHVDHVRSLHYADAGLDLALTQLAADPAYVGTGGNVTLGNGTYNVTVTPHPSDSSLRIVTAVGSYPNTEPSPRSDRVQAIVRVSPKYFNYGLFGDNSLRMVGGTSVYGGYNSSLGELPQAPYLKAPADLGTNATTASAIRITGSLFGPYTTAWCGQGTLLPAPDYCVQINGSANYRGAAVMTTPSPLPTVTAPTPPYTPPTLTINGGNYAFNLANALVFHPAGFPSGHYAVRLANFSIAGSAVIRITDPAITRLYTYVDGNCSLAGSGTVGDTTTYKATQFIVYALGGSTVTVGGGGTIVAGIFAKNATVSMTGGATVYGAVAANSIDGNGSYNFYFDQGLKDLSAGQTGSATLVVWEHR